MRSIKLFAIVATVGSIGCGCGRDVRLAGKTVRHVQVKPVSHYGVTLDQSATPEQVAFVALRSIREDFFAATPEQSRAASDIQFDVAAADVIAARNRSSLTRDEYVHHVVSRWTPAISHYAADFEVEAPLALSRFTNRGLSKSSGAEPAECELAMEVDDPSGDPAGKVVIVTWLAKDGGLWRVTHFGFEPKRTLSSAKTTAAASAPGS